MIVCNGELLGCGGNICVDTAVSTAVVVVIVGSPMGSAGVPVATGAGGAWGGRGDRLNGR